MIDASNHQADALARKFKSAPDPLSFPKTLAGTWSAGGDLGAEQARDNALRHVAALDSVRTALPSFCRRALLYAQSSNSVPGMRLLFGRADSQGRMDLFASLTARVKDFLKPAFADDRRVMGGMQRSRP
ncbi:MAG: hypothetical protein AAGA21_13975 [Pseudomonadota bacterium]